MADLAELNVNTMNIWVKNNASFDELMQAEKPEEPLTAQAKLANIASLEAIKYAQQACTIWMDAATQAGKVFTETLRETTNKASDFVRSGIKNKEKGQQQQ